MNDEKYISEKNTKKIQIWIAISNWGNIKKKYLFSNRGRK